MDIFIFMTNNVESEWKKNKIDTTKFNGELIFEVFRDIEAKMKCNRA